MDKKNSVKRIVLFTVLAFSLTAFFIVVFNNILSGNRYFPETQEDGNPFNIFAGYAAMLGPASAVFITRKITKEGMSEHMLIPGFEKNLKYYIMSFVTVLSLYLACALLLPVYSGCGYAANEMAARLSTIVSGLWLQFALILIYFGEEYGWRGYLFPKLEKLTGIVPAVFITGIIWGVWHTPVLLLGQNFGRDLKYYPLSNIGLMCLMCIFITPFLVYVSRKSNSVWPAAAGHFLFNNLQGVMMTMFLDIKEDEITETKSLAHQSLTVLFIFLAVLFAVYMILLISDNKKNNSKTSGDKRNNLKLNTAVTR